MRSRPIDARALDRAFQMGEWVTGKTFEFGLRISGPEIVGATLSPSVRSFKDGLYRFDHQHLDAHSALLLLEEALGGAPTRTAEAIRPNAKGRATAIRRRVLFRYTSSCARFFDPYPGPEQTVSRTILPPGGSQGSATAGLLAGVHLVALRRADAQYSAVLVPVRLPDPHLAGATGNLSSSHLSIAVRHDDLRAVSERFLSAAGSHREKALRRLERYGRLPTTLRRLVAAVSRMTRSPKESAVLSRLNLAGQFPLLSQREVHFVVPLRDPRSLAIGVVRYDSRINLTFTARTSLVELEQAANEIMAACCQQWEASNGE